MRRERTKSLKGRTGRTLLLAVVIGGMVTTTLLVQAVRGGEGAQLRRLAVAVGPHRVTRARLTGGFAYAPCDTVAPNAGVVSGMSCQGARPGQQPSASPELSKLAVSIRAKGEAAVYSARHRQLAAAWHLVWDDAAAAIGELQTAAQLAPADGRIQNDLAAALLARAQQLQDPRLILDAFNAVDSALVLIPRQPEARFNRALILDWLGLRKDATAAWSAFLEVDARSPWADEARSRLRQLGSSLPPWTEVQDSFRHAAAAGQYDAAAGIARQYPAAVRREAERAMIDWALADKSSPGSRADTLLAYARIVARAAATTGDSLWSDASEALVSREPSRVAQRHVVARGIVAYDRGNTYLNGFLLDSAQVYFTQAKSALGATQNAAQYWADFGLASVAYTRQTSADYEHSLSILRALRADAPNAYRVVRGLAARTEGVILGIAADFSGAISAYSAAIAEGRGTGDPGLELRPHANLAGNYAGLGDDRAAWIHLADALRAAPHYIEASSDRQRILTRSAELSARRAPSLALLFQREGTLLASRLNANAADSMVMVTALRREAELLGNQGKSGAALETVRRARAYLANIESDSIRAISNADLDLVEGQAWLKLRPDTAVEILQRVVDRFRNTQYFRQVARAQVLLANAYVRSGEMQLGQGAFEAALAEVERRRSNITSAEDRARFLDQARPVIDTLVWMLADRGDTVKALAFLEQMRSRVLLERVRQDSSKTGVTDDAVNGMQRSLPATTSIVSYAVQKGEVIAWVVRRDGVRMFRTPTRLDVERLTSRFSTLVASQSGEPETRGIAEELYRLLITPVARMVEPNGRLVIVPDKWLQFIPFAALFDPAAGKFLVQQFETTIAPSLELYAQSAMRYDELQRTPARPILAVGNPAFDAHVFSLPPLPGAEREAKGVAASYDQSEVLVGAQATKQAVLAAAGGSSVIHFAGHGVVRSDAPLLSYLLLAPGADNADGMLTARELFRHELPATRLAILSGCQTANGRLSETEGVSSLARAFFAAGVPAVVASLWSVDDEATADFFVEYHKALASGGDPSAALRTTQLNWVAKKGWSGASTWAAFTLFGASGNGAPIRSTEYRDSRSRSH